MKIIKRLLGIDQLEFRLWRVLKRQNDELQDIKTILMQMNQAPPPVTSFGDEDLWKREQRQQENETNGSTLNELWRK